MIKASAILFVALFAGISETMAGTNAYEVIAERDSFSLRAGAAPSVAPPANAPAFRLNGVAAVNGRRWAFLVQEQRGQPPQYLMIEEGQMLGPIEVCDVDAERGEVHVVINKRELLLLLGAHETETHAIWKAEARFVAEHTRAHEKLQQREQQRLAREAEQTANAALPQGQ